MKKQSAIASARAATKYKNFQYLSRFCKLEPVFIWKIWKDNSNNILKINKNISIIKSKNLISTDIFVKANIKHIYNNSFWCYLNKNYLFLMGNDDILRCYMIHENKNISPILTGFELITKVIDSFISKKTSTNFGFLNNLEKELEKSICLVIK